MLTFAFAVFKLLAF